MIVQSALYGSSMNPELQRPIAFEMTSMITRMYSSSSWKALDDSMQRLVVLFGEDQDCRPEYDINVCLMQ